MLCKVGREGFDAARDDVRGCVERGRRKRSLSRPESAPSHQRPPKLLPCPLSGLARLPTNLDLGAMLSSSTSVSPPPAIPLVLSLCASSALLLVLSSPLAFSASFSLLDVSTPLPDNSVLVQGLGVWGSCYTQG